MSSYTEQETREIVHALKILGEKGFPVLPEIFDAWCGACITTPVELAVLRMDKNIGKPEVLMIHRKDKYFHGWHIPGSIMLPGETEETVFSRLARKEIFGKISLPQFVDRIHTMKGTGNEESLRGQTAALLFVCSLEKTQGTSGTFFPLENPPDDTLGHHKLLLKRVARWWQETQR